MSRATAPLVWGAVVHLVVDWLLQNRWIAEHKTDLTSPAGCLHAALHAAGMPLVFPPLAALALGVVHPVIDTRWPLRAPARVVSHAEDGAIGVAVHIRRDQALHIACIAAAALTVA